MNGTLQKFTSDLMGGSSLDLPVSTTVRPGPWQVYLLICLSTAYLSGPVSLKSSHAKVHECMLRNQIEHEALITYVSIKGQVDTEGF